MATFGSGILGSANIADNSITTAKILDAAVTVGKMAATGTLPAFNGSALTNVNTAFVKVATVTLTAVGTTLDFPSLDINTDKNYFIVINGENNAASDADVNLYVNNDTTDTNYYFQYFLANGAVNSGGRANVPAVAYMSASSQIYCTIMFGRTVDGYVYANSISSRLRDAGIQLMQRVYTKTATVANVTQLTIVATQNFKIGTTATIFKMG